MSDPEVVVDDVEAMESTDEDEGRGSKRWLVLLLLLLLLLCGVTVIVDQWINRGPDRARFVTRNLECLQCHTELIPDLSRTSVHSPFMIKECTVCHTPHGKEVERSLFSGGSRTWSRVRTLVEWLPLKWMLAAYDSTSGTERTEEGGVLVDVTTERLSGAESNLVAPIDELCWICHGSMGAQRMMAHTHNPFEKGFCVTCHSPHASDHRALLVQDERDLCMTCHPIGPELAREQVHPPFGGRYCTNCHDPHASEWRGILVSRQRDLCFMCHPTVAPLSLKAVQHQPFEYDNCTGCHEPHGSNFRPLLIKDQPPLCYDCHPAIANDFDQASIHPVDTLQLDCGDCHNPHAADYAALLVARDNALCYGCHGTTIRVRYEDSGHQRTLCISCHTPHGSAWAPILRANNPDLCLRCHEPAYYDESSTTVRRNNHPVRPKHYDVNNKSPLTCTSSCHNPHGTRYTKMLRYMDAPFDGNCLICHGVTPGKMVGVDF
ncbi:MAG: cytochrome c3 family protein [Coriobacteriia bacterium]|nr:cytochrome c3 family protein [Coriobacteriia bacterium]